MKAAIFILFLCASIVVAQNVTLLAFGAFSINVYPGAGQYFAFNPMGYQALVTVRESARSPALPQGAMQDPCAFIRIRAGYVPTDARQGYSQNIPQTAAVAQIYLSAINCNWYIYISPVQSAITPGYTTPTNCTIALYAGTQQPLQQGLEQALCAQETAYQNGLTATPTFTPTPALSTTASPSNGTKNAAGALVYSCAVLIACLFIALVAE